MCYAALCVASPGKASYNRFVFFFRFTSNVHYDVYDAGLEFKHLQPELTVNGDATLYDAILDYWEESSEFC